MSERRSRSVVPALLILVAAGSAAAGEPKHEVRVHVPHTHHRAGHPLSVHGHAAPTVTPHFRGGYVGGGALFGGHARRPIEGTWGYDYVGPHVSPRRVFLGWGHGRKWQGGTGSYATEGPRPVRGLLGRFHGHE